MTQLKLTDKVKTFVIPIKRQLNNIPNIDFECVNCRENSVIILNPSVGDKLQVTNTDNMLKAQENSDEASGELTLCAFHFSKSCSP